VLALRSERLDLFEIASATASELAFAARAHGVSIVVEGGPAFVRGDADRLRQVFLNLIDNAVRYSPQGQAVTLRVVSDGRKVLASVHDCGQGIAAADLPHIFERFYRGDRSRRRADDGSSGAGLGLAIVQALVQAQGGTITVESVDRAGTTVCFTLPAA
jgi:two-component system sensor histidine kinase BaeS